MRGGNLSFLAVIILLITVSVYVSFSGVQGLAETVSEPCKVAGERWNYEANSNLPPFDCCPYLRACPDGYCCETKEQVTGQAISKALAEPAKKSDPVTIFVPVTMETIACYQNSDCGTDGWVGNPYCQGGHVYQDWRTWTCSNPGTTSSSCSHSDHEKNKQGCGEDSYGTWSSPYCKYGDVYQKRTITDNGCANGHCFSNTGAEEKLIEGCFECSGGECIEIDYEPEAEPESRTAITSNQASVETIDCYKNSDCGTDGWTGSPYCKDGDVWQKWRTWTCSNPGTPSASCPHSDQEKNKLNCVAGCFGGICAFASSYACDSNADCGTDGWLNQEYCCSGGGENTDVCDKYRTHTCHNPATPAAYCTHSDEDKVKEDCGDTSCGNWGDPFCDNGDVYHAKECIQRGCRRNGAIHCFSDGYTDIEKLEECGTRPCQNGQCVDIACYQNSDCGTDGWTGSPYCKDGDVYQIWRTYTCNSPGTPGASCSHSDNEQKKQDCGPNGCSGGQCNTGTITCYQNSDCGTDGWVGNPYCQGGDVYQDWRTWTCSNPGTTSSSCSSSTEGQKKQDCGSNGCSGGACNTGAITCHSNSDCGTDGWVGNPYCQGGDVWQAWKTFTCNNPGTTSSYCSDTSQNKKKQDCQNGCSDGQCVSGGGSKPDLTISGLRVMWPPSPKAGQPVSFEFKVRNIGANGIENIEVKFTTKNSNWDAPLMTLDSEKETYVYHDHTFSSPGTYTVTVRADPNDRIDESNENNNQMSITVKVT